MALESSGGKKPNTIKLTRYCSIGPTEKCFIIAEIGQNHQGDLLIAKQMILQAKECGADCVKFQKSHLPSKFNSQAFLRPYENSNSWGKTYGAHKKFLEFTQDDFIELQRYSNDVGILFSSSAMDEVSLLFLNSINVPFIKIGSGDFHNAKLLEKAIGLQKPLIISTGMSNVNEVKEVYNVLKTEHLNFCFLHCVSSYPVPYEDVNLRVLESYRKLFPDINIGYSGHELGIDVTLAAVSLGAKIIERHFTLDKALKGTDHICSLTPSEFKEMVHKIRLFESKQIVFDSILSTESVQKALGGFKKKFQDSEFVCFKKLGKTAVAAVTIQAGDIITWDNICLKVAYPKGIPGNFVSNVIGKTAKRVIQKDESIMEDFLM